MTEHWLADYHNRKGSLYLHSNQMNYGKATLNSNWHHARDGDPKDYDLNTDDRRNLGISTYKRFGTSVNTLQKTTYQELTDQLNLKDIFTEQKRQHPMINFKTIDHAGIDRELGTPKHGYGSVLPRHNPDYNKYNSGSTYRLDYQPLDPDYVLVTERPPAFESATYRKCQSQFNDTADYKRIGANTWQDESGIYANTHHKHEVYQPTSTIPPQII